MQGHALLGPSKNQILSQLAARERTAKEIANSLGIQVSAVRKHLDNLERLRIVRQEFRKEGVGRPRKYYILTDKGRELFPRNYDGVLSAVLAKLVQRKGGAFAESIMNGIANDLAKAMNGAERSSGHIPNIVKGLNQLGFQATIEDDSRGFQVTSRNCPLLKTASEHQDLVCKGLHENLLAKALGSESVNRSRWILSGDSFCEHLVSKKELAQKK